MDFLTFKTKVIDVKNGLSSRKLKPFDKVGNFKVSFE
jgi:hypothetical protein